MYRTVIDDQFEVPIYEWKYVGPSEVDVKILSARWLWMWDVLAKLPEGKVIMFPVPQTLDCARFANMIRSAVAQNKKTLYHHWSIRTAKDGSYIVVAKGKPWLTWAEQEAHGAGTVPVR